MCNRKSGIQLSDCESKNNRVWVATTRLQGSVSLPLNFEFEEEFSRKISFTAFFPWGKYGMKSTSRHQIASHWKLMNDFFFFQFSTQLCCLIGNRVDQGNSSADFINFMIDFICMHK